MKINTENVDLCCKQSHKFLNITRLEMFTVYEVMGKKTCSLTKAVLLPSFPKVNLVRFWDKEKYNRLPCESQAPYHQVFKKPEGY